MNTASANFNILPIRRVNFVLFRPSLAPKPCKEKLVLKFMTRLSLIFLM